MLYLCMAYTVNGTSTIVHLCFPLRLSLCTPRRIHFIPIYPSKSKDQRCSSSRVSCNRAKWTQPPRNDRWISKLSRRSISLGSCLKVSSITSSLLISSTCAYINLVWLYDVVILKNGFGLGTTTGSIYLLGTLFDQTAIIHLQRTILVSESTPELIQSGLESINVFLENRPVCPSCPSPPPSTPNPLISSRLLTCVNLADES